ncbi:MAG: TIGR00282 family metallophosphoesterase [Patescibacteria group bacterium]|jgi:hypothetical protein
MKEGMKLLIYGDVVGKLGRAGVRLAIDEWRKETNTDIVIANAENVAHGKGIGEKQLAELRNAGVDVFTGGNHSVEGKNAGLLLNDETLPITRPANMSSALPGRGVIVFEKNGVAPLVVINLIGQVNMRQAYDSPFHKLDDILETYQETSPFKIIDWHADVTSEKNIMGWYADGKVSLVYGTHAHVPTADARILPKGTGYISDIGMTGPHHSIIGVTVEPSIIRFRDQIMRPMDVVESGPIEVHAIAVSLDPTGRTVDIRHLRKIIDTYTI